MRPNTDIEATERLREAGNERRSCPLPFLANHRLSSHHTLPCATCRTPSMVTEVSATLVETEVYSWGIGARRDGPPTYPIAKTGVILWRLPLTNHKMKKTSGWRR